MLYVVTFVQSTAIQKAELTRFVAIAAIHCITGEGLRLLKV